MVEFLPKIIKNYFIFIWKSIMALLYNNYDLKSTDGFSIEKDTYFNII
ncbi:hypothetical protein SAMN05444360_11769 [Chryseobacterium carnipullorum]|nr:hypothetical protein SAMN05444360_11769 [Chryseobacterium carnipullorum]